MALFNKKQDKQMLTLFVVFFPVGNPVCMWSEMSNLGRSFPALDSLVLADCPLPTLDPSLPGTFSIIYLYFILL